MRRSRKASRNEALVATVSPRRVEEPAARLGVLGPPGDEAPAEGHEDPFRLAARFRRTLVLRILSWGPGRAVPDPEHRVGRGDVPARGLFAVGPLGQGGPEIAGDPGRGGVESEAAAHAGSIVAHVGPRRGVRPPDLGLRLPERSGTRPGYGTNICSLSLPGTRRPPVPGSSPPGWPTGSGPPRRWPGGPCRCPRRWPRSSRPAPCGGARPPRWRGRPATAPPPWPWPSWPRRRPPGAGAPPWACPIPGVVAAAGLGLDLRRVVFVPHPGNGWAEAAGDLLSGVDAVLVRPPGRARLTAARHLTARARERQAALVVLLEGPGAWPEGGDLALSVGAVEWEGVGRGHGHLRGPPGRGAGQRPPGRRPGQRVLALAPRRLGRGRGRGDRRRTRRTQRRRDERKARRRGTRVSGAGPGGGPEAA